MQCFGGDPEITMSLFSSDFFNFFSQDDNNNFWRAIMEECTENKETEEEDNENLFLAYSYVDLH